MTVEKLLAAAVLIAAVGISFGIILVFATLAGDDFEGLKSIRDSLIRKKKAKTYPSVPLTMVTEHFGWSYGFDKHSEWTYYVWYVQKGKKNVIMEKHGTKSGSKKRCEDLENEFFGGGEQ